MKRSARHAPHYTPHCTAHPVITMIERRASDKNSIFWNPFNKSSLAAPLLFLAFSGLGLIAWLCQASQGM